MDRRHATGWTGPADPEDAAERFDMEGYLAQLLRSPEGVRSGDREGLKELRCIYAVDLALQHPGADWTSRLRGVAEAIPAGLRSPKRTAIALRLGDALVSTAGFRRTEWSSGHPIAGPSGEHGELEVCRLAALPDDAGGAFLPEEEDLLAAIAHRLGGAWRAQARTERLRLVNTALEAAHDGVVITDREGVIEWVNPAFTRITGYSENEARGRTPGELLRSGAHDEGFFRDLWETILRGEVWRGRTTNRRKDGGLYTEEQKVTPVLDASGRISHFIAIKSDVTARVEAEEEQRRLLSVIDATPELVGMADPQGRLLYINEGGRILLGLDAGEDVRGRDLSEFHPRWAAEIVRQEGIPAALAEGAWSGETALLGPGGEEIPVWQQILGHRSASGGAEFLSTMTRDLREVKRSSAQIRFQADLMRAVGQAVIATDLDGEVLHWNQAAEEIYGWTADEAMGRGIGQLDVPGIFADGTDEILARLSRGETWTGELDVRRRDGELRQVLVTHSPIVDSDGRLTGSIGISSDVTELRKVEGQFRQAQKMDAVGRLAGGVAHDFNNLLTVIQGHVEMILEEASDRFPFREDLQQVLGEARRAAALTRQLLAFSRQQVLARKRLDLARALAELEPILRRLIPERIELRFELDSDPQVVRADPVNLQQIFMNLAVNASHAIHAAGRITFRVDSRTLSSRDAEALPWAVLPGPYARLTVEDTGIGISPQDLERIFEPFFTTKPTGQGTGLGLSMVYGTVKQLGGHILVDSTPGEGTTFQLLFPRLETQEDDGSEAAVASPRTAPSEGGETVLLVEDEPSVRAILQRALERAGFAVIPAENGTDALAAVERHGGRIDLLVSDVVMPQMGGSELIDLLSDRLPDLRVVLMSGYTSDELSHEVRQKATAFLEKPFSPDALSRLVRELLD